MNSIQRAFPILLILSIHFFMQGAVLGLADLGQMDYFSHVLLFETIWERETLFVIFPLVTLLYRGRSNISWSSIDNSGTTRVLMLSIGVILTWYFATYNSNLYFGQEHLLDRIVLVLLCAGIWIHPVFVIAFTWLVTVIACQFQYPTFDFELFFTDKRLLHDLLLLFVSFVIVRIFYPLRRSDFLTLGLGMIGVFYAYAAWVKIVEGPYLGSWVCENELLSLLLSSHQYGWLGNVEDETLIKLWTQLKPLNVPFGVATILLEGAGLLVLWRLRFARIAMFGFILLHLMILATTGIFFWAWILLDTVLIAILWKAPTNLVKEIYDPKNRLSIVLIFVGGFVAFRPINFVWFDGRASTPYQIEAIGQSGKRYRISPDYFSLYDVEMGQRRFHFLNRDPTLMETYGSTTYEIAKKLRESDFNTYKDLPGQLGKVRYDPKRTELFTTFLHRYLSQVGEPSPFLQALNALSPPHHFQTSEPEGVYRGEEPLTHFEVFLEDYFFDGKQIHSRSPKRVLDQSIEPAKQ